MAAQYHFLSEYTMTSDREAIWAALTTVATWHEWWRALKHVDVIKGATSEDGVGAVYGNHVRAPTGYGFVYSTEITEIDRPSRIDIISSGDIVGRGRFLLSDSPSGGTDVSFAWLVETPKWWMNLLVPLARPAFTWNHDKLMTDFGRGLARTAGGELTKVRNSTVKPGSPGFHVMPAVQG